MEMPNKKTLRDSILLTVTILLNISTQIIKELILKLSILDKLSRQKFSFILVIIEWILKS
jgi:hypothetical protein